MQNNFNKIIAVAIFICCSFFSNAQTANDTYHLLRRMHVGGRGGWDYITAYNGNLYIAHDSLVNVIDEKTGDSIAIIEGTIGAHGIAFANGKGYITAGRISSVIVFDQKTNRTTKTIKTSAGPDAIMYEPFTKKIFVCNGRARQATIIDPVNDKVVDTIALGGKPETPATDEAGNIFVNIEDKNEVVQINAKKFSIVNRWKIGKGESPSGLAIDIKNHRLFAACDNKLMVVLNSITGIVVAELPTGDGTDGAAFDDSLRNVFSPNGEGTLTVIHEDTPDKFSVIINVLTQKGARTITLDPQNHHLFLPTADFGESPAATSEHPHPRPVIIPNSFQLLEIGK